MSSLLTASWMWLAGGALIGFWLLGAYNRLVRLRAALFATFPSLEVQLRKRHNLVRDLLAALTQPRSSAAIAAEASREAGPDLGAGGDADTQAASPLPARDTPADPSATALERVADANRVAAQALDRMGRRAMAGGGWSSLPGVEAAERDLDAAVSGLVSCLQLAALEAPLSAAVAESLDRLQRVRKPIAYCLEVYNEAAALHNAALRVVPTSLAARLFQFRPATLFDCQRAPPDAQPSSESQPG